MQSMHAQLTHQTSDSHENGHALVLVLWTGLDGDQPDGHTKNDQEWHESGKENRNQALQGTEGSGTCWKEVQRYSWKFTQEWGEAGPKYTITDYPRQN